MSICTQLNLENVPTCNNELINNEPYMSVSESVTGFNKSLDILTGSGFKKMMDKAIHTMTEKHPENRYEFKPNSMRIERQINEDGSGTVKVSAEVRHKARLERTERTVIRTADLSRIEHKFAELYDINGVDNEEFIKAMAITQAMNSFTTLQKESPDHAIRFVKAEVSFNSPQRYVVDVTYTTLP